MLRSALFILALILAPPCQLLAEISVVFGPSPKLQETINREIEDAKWTIDVAIYRLDDNAIVKSIITAAQEGVRVRVMLHQPEKHAKLANKLEEAGVVVRSANLTMHHKFLISDSTKLLTGSGNWTKTAFRRYDEDLLLFVQEQAYVNSFRREFETMWSISKAFGKDVFAPSKLVREKPSFGRVLFTSANMKIKEHRGNRIYSPDAELPGTCGAELIAAIKKAEKSIKIATTHFRRADIADSLRNAIRRGVQVEVLLDQQEFHSKATKQDDVLYDEQLAQAGAAVKYKCYTSKWNFQRSFQMHSKYMIVDNRTVFTGSLNWSRTSELSSLENLVIIDRTEVAQAYLDRFKMKWSYGSGQFKTIFKERKGAPLDEPFYFSPISLTGNQVIEITD